MLHDFCKKMNKLQTSLFNNGFIIVLTCLKFVQQAPLLMHEARYNLTSGNMQSQPTGEMNTRPINIHHRDLHLLKVSPLNIADGLTFQEKLEVVSYLSAIEQREEHNKHIITKSTSDNTVPYVFEEDIILTPQQAEILYSSRNPRQKRKLNTDLHKHWILPIQYAFDGTHNDSEKSIIRSALQYWESYTCITFQEIAYKDNASINENNVYIVFTNNEGCWSFVGRGTLTEQKVSIYKDCVYEGHVLHEIGHAIGFWHEHARPDRDQYITVQEDNIKYGKRYNFLHISWKDLDTKNMPYDVGSIMHYGSTAYAIEYTNPAPPTIVTKDPLLQRALGQRFQLSYYDVKLANLAYCSDKCNGTTLQKPCQYDGYQDPKYCSQCRCTDGLAGQYCETVAPSLGDRCGGELNVTGTETTFGFPGAYRFNQQCNWFLKAPANSRIFFNIVSSHIMDYPNCSSSNQYVECLNYVEVRYAHNIAKTGARICCSYLDSNKPIVSEGSKMLVLMRSFTDGSHGFQAKVWAETCGGCKTGTELTHKPCSRSVSYTCEHTWNYTVWNACPSGWWWSKSPDCDKLVNKTAVRQGICYKSELYCCNGYELNVDLCIKTTDPTLQSVVIQIDGASSSEYLVPTNNPSGLKENDPGSGWGNWTQWSNCSQPCGGCGNQTRQRFCHDPLYCSGKTMEIESRQCNTSPCTHSSFGTRTKATVITNPITLQKTTIYEKETYPIVTEYCCSGYFKDTNNRCIKVVTT